MELSETASNDDELERMLTTCLTRAGDAQPGNCALMYDLSKSS